MPAFTGHSHHTTQSRSGLGGGSSVQTALLLVIRAVGETITGHPTVQRAPQELQPAHPTRMPTPHPLARPELPALRRDLVAVQLRVATACAEPNG